MMQHPCALVIPTRGGLCLHHSAALVSPAHEGWSSCQLRVVGGPWSGIGHCWVGDRACWVWDRALTALAPCTWILLAEQAAEQARCAVPACRFSRKHAHRWDGEAARHVRAPALPSLPARSCEPTCEPTQHARPGSQRSHSVAWFLPRPPAAGPPDAFDLCCTLKTVTALWVCVHTCAAAWIQALRRA